MEKGRTMMGLAESALEVFLIGKEMNRQQCSRRGIGASDAEIRWAGTTSAKKALSDNSFNVSQATMYFVAAAAHYSRAAYLRSQTMCAGTRSGHN
jgi:hypothetical protein